jgi:hypothetical protein
MRGRLGRECGAIAVVAAVVLFAVGAFMALAINAGQILHAKGQLQNASDSAALAAAGSLNGTLVGLGNARHMAYHFAHAHRVATEHVNIVLPDDVIFGRWHYKAEQGIDGNAWAAHSFEPLSAGSPLMIDAVRVLDARDGSGQHNSAMEVFFGHFLGARTATIGTSAVAVGRSGESECPMPFVLPSCSLQNPDGTWICNTNVTLILSPDGTDNVGFIYFLAALGIGGTGNSDVPPNILNRCQGQGTASNYPVSNGNDLNTNVIQAMLGLAGNGVNMAPVPPYEPDGSSSLCIFNHDFDSFPVAEMSCPNPKFNQDVVVAAYARIDFVAVTSSGKLYQSCPTGPVNWNNYVKFSVPDAATSAKTMVVNVACDAHNGLTYHNGVDLRLVQ